MADFTGRKAIFLNRSQDGLKLRAKTFKSKKVYNRKDQTWKKVRSDERAPGSPGALFSLSPTHRAFLATERRIR